MAFGITVPKPLGDTLILDALAATGGTALAVRTRRCSPTCAECARLDGEFMCPEGAACLTAVRHLRQSGWLHETEEVLVLNTGTGLNYPDTVPAHAPVLPPSGSNSGTQPGG